MSGDTKIVHVAWGESRAETVRNVLRLLGIEARVIALSGILSVGPLDPLGSTSRQAWARANLRGDNPDEDWNESEATWAEAISTEIRPVYWVCFSDPAEHASFLAFASRMSDQPFDIVDATGITVSAPGVTSPIWSLGQVRPTEIVKSNIYARRRPVLPAEREAASVAWSRLQRENAPLRIMRKGRLVSVPMTHFDAVLIGQTRPSWILVVKLIARTLDYLIDGTRSTGQGVPYEFLFARLLALAKVSALEIRGAGPGMRDYEGRLPASL